MERLGPSLDRAISVRTGIPETILTVYDAGSVPGIKAVSRWMSGRTTTRPEDMVYCLLGILDVRMYLSYGEGIERAYERLKEAIEIEAQRSARRSKQPGMVPSWVAAPDVPVPPASGSRSSRDPPPPSTSLVNPALHANGRHHHPYMRDTGAVHAGFHNGRYPARRTMAGEDESDDDDGE